VVEGMDIIDKMVAVETGSVGAHQDVPVEPLIINSVTRIEAD
jgi:cyclophilin family peptidyl-prolyl cis-trans isomerase